jgi:lipopolysaccharide/colanic/teichoic acid biosynthesis glycosyltransferase
MTPEAVLAGRRPQKPMTIHPCSPLTGAFRPAASSRLSWRGLQELAIRSVDILVSAFLIVLLFPTGLLLALAVRLETPGGVFFRCLRVGRHGRDLHVLKFRKMHADAAGPPLTITADGRLTDVGRFLARSKFDELPQLWSVLRGEMSLVGPRPEDPHFVALQRDAFREIHTVRPGITGLSQLAFAGETSLLRGNDAYGYYVERLLPQKVVIDRLYVEHRSLWLNMKILFWTGRVVLFGCSVAVDRRTGAITVRHARAQAGASPVPALEGAEQTTR